MKPQSLILLFFFAFLIFPTRTYSSNIDSLQQVLRKVEEKEKIIIYNQLTKQFFPEDFDSAFYFANQAMDLSIIHHKDDQLGIAYKNIGLFYSYKSNYEQQLLINELIEKIEKLLKENEEIKTLLAKDHK